MSSRNAPTHFSDDTNNGCVTDYLKRNILFKSAVDLIASLRSRRWEVAGERENGCTRLFYKFRSFRKFIAKNR